MHRDTIARIGRTPVLVLLFTAATTAAGCGPSVLVPCRELQNLRLGMSKGDVIARLGAPVHEFPLDQVHRQVRQDADLGLDYSNNGWDGVRMSLEFSNGALIHVSSYRKRPLSPGSEESLFRLERGQAPYVGPNFERYLCVTSY